MSLTQSNSLLVSVVVIGRNEGERLRACLSSVVGMLREGFNLEIIYVDSGSVDNSAAVAEEYGARVLSLQPSYPTAALGRNAGWRVAAGSIVLFLDGDTILDRRFVVDCLTEFDAPDIAVVWGHRRELYPRKSIYNRVLDLDWISRPGLSTFCGGDALFRRYILEQTGGYDDALIAGEEPELCRRIAALGYKILHVDRPMTGHDLAMTRWRQYWKRAIRTGHAYAEVSDRFKTADMPFWLAESRANRNRALQICLLLAMAFAFALLLRSLWPIAGVAVLFAVLAIRSAWKARWKSSDRGALLLYGLHSHLQQIPIYLGQLQFRRNQRQDKRSMLLEYK